MEVFALVGPSGTGKSHRAYLLASQLQVDLIIDDGLLIRDGKILGGLSAKREASKLAAIRRAIFTYPEHARQAREILQQLSPRRVLILGTSPGMASKIAATLELPPPTQVIPIQEVASEAEIDRALRVRHEEGTHVIPAPTLEVRKSFSGYLVNPLRLILRGQPVAVEKSLVRPTWSSLGRFFISDRVVRDIAQHAAAAVPGVSRVRRVTMQSWPNGVVLHLGLVLVYGNGLRSVLEQAQHSVKDQVEYMTALNVLQVNLVAHRVAAG